MLMWSRRNPFYGSFLYHYSWKNNEIGNDVSNIILYLKSSWTINRVNKTADHEKLKRWLTQIEEYVHGDQKVSVHLIITIQKVTSNVQSVPRQSPDIYSQAELCSRTPCSV